MHASSEAFPGGRGWRRIYIPGGLGPRLDNDDDQGTETRKTSQFRESDSEKGRGQGRRGRGGRPPAQGCGDCGGWVTGGAQPARTSPRGTPSSPSWKRPPGLRLWPQGRR